VKHMILDLCAPMSLVLTMTCKRNILNFPKINGEKCTLEFELLRTGTLIHLDGSSAISYYCTWV